MQKEKLQNPNFKMRVAQDKARVAVKTAQYDTYTPHDIDLEEKEVAHKFNSNRIQNSEGLIDVSKTTFKQKECEDYGYDQVVSCQKKRVEEHGHKGVCYKARKLVDTEFTIKWQLRGWNGSDDEDGDDDYRPPVTRVPGIPKKGVHLTPTIGVPGSNTPIRKIFIDRAKVPRAIPSGGSIVMTYDRNLNGCAPVSEAALLEIDRRRDHKKNIKAIKQIGTQRTLAARDLYRTRSYSRQEGYYRKTR